MSRRPMIAGNWKMNKTPQETQQFVEAFLAYPRASLCDVLLIPPFTSLDRAHRLLEGTDILLGAQDLHAAASGAFTGAISATMLEACGCAFVLVGHSERRHVFKDSDQDVSGKLHAALAHHLVAILCIGETLEQREAERTQHVLEEQLSGGLNGIDEQALDRVVIAYEPVWAIGTGKTATPQQAQQTIATVREWIASHYSDCAAANMRILYGGSVKPDNAKQLQAQPDIDGALIGGASLDPESLAQIIAEAMSIEEGGDSC